MTQPHNSIHILLVEDDADLSRSLTSYLSGAGFMVTAVDSCLACYAALPKSRYHVAVLDVSLPDQSGFVLAEYLRANTTLKIIILTAHERIEDKVRGYAAGAHNYFVKPVDARELQAAIMSLVDSEHQNAAEMLDETWHLARLSWQLKTGQGNSIKLTLLEFQFVELLASSPGNVVSREILLNAMYNRNDEHSARALDSLVRRLRAKISAGGHVSPIMTAHAVGFCFSAPIIID